MSAAMGRIEPNLVEEGFALHVAQRIAAGEHMYRDIVFFSGPVPFEALSLLFRWLGDEIVVARGAVALLHGLTTGLVYLLVRAAGAGAMSHPAAAVLAAAPVLLFPLFSIYFHTTIAFYCAIAALYAASRAIGSTRWGFAAGVMLALVGFTKQSIGAALGVALLVALAKTVPARFRVPRLASLVLGTALTSAAIVGVFAARGDLEPLVNALAVLPLTLGDTFRSPYPNLWPPGRFSEEIAPHRILYLPKLYALLFGAFAWSGRGAVVLAQVLFALPWLALFATLLRHWRKPLLPAAWVHTAGAAALMTNLYPRSDWGHLAYALPLTLTQLLLLAGSGGITTARRSRLQAAGLTTALLATALFAGVTLQLRTLPFTLGRLTMPALGSELGSIAPVVDFLIEHTEPGDPIFVARAEPLVYYVTGTRNPTPYEGILPGLPGQEEGVLAGLEEARYVVMSDVDQPAMSFYSDELPRVHAYLERHFRPAEGFEEIWNTVVVLERGPDQGAPLIDLVNRWPTGRRWVRGEDGTEEVALRKPPRLVGRQNRRPVPAPIATLGGGVDLAIEVPENALFRSEVGIIGISSSQGLVRRPRFVTMAVSVAAAEGTFEQLASVQLGAMRDLKGWVPIEADLSSYGGQTVTLRLEALPRREVQPGSIVWWGSPRIVAEGASP